MAVSDFHRTMADAAANGRTPRFRSTSPSTDDARYVAGNRARNDAQRARNASNPSFSGLLQRVFNGDPRARDRSTFRNAGPSQGIFGEPGLFSGGSKLGISDFIPFGGLINYMTRRPVDSGATYTMNTQGGTGPGMTAAQISAKYGVSPQVAAASMKAAPAAQTGAPVPPVAVEPLLGYGFEEDKFGFDPQAPRATLDDLDIDLNPGYSQIADGQYVPSYDPFAASESISAPSEAALDFDAWLSSDQGQAMANKGLPEKNLRSMHNIYLKLNSGKF